MIATMEAKAAPTIRTTRACAGCKVLVTVPGVPVTAIALPVWCQRCSPAGPFGPPAEAQP